MKRVLSFLLFLLIFLYEVISANINVAYIILFVKKSAINPQFFFYDVSDLNNKEALFLAQCITLTPGTITAEYDKEKMRLTIHCLDYRDPESVQSTITNNIKAPILRFTR